MKLLLAPGLALLYAAFQMPAEPPMKMGLWEMTTVTQMQMPDMPNMPGMGPRTTKAHVCLTRDSYEKSLSQQGPQAKNCTLTNKNWSGNTYSFDMTCNDGKLNGHFEGTWDSPTTAHSKTHMTMNAGRTMTIDGASTSSFLGADCGSVTPEKPQIIH